MEKYQMTDFLNYICSENSELVDFSYEISKKLYNNGEYFKNPTGKKTALDYKSIVKSLIRLFPKKLPAYSNKVIQSSVYINLSEYNCFDKVRIEKPLWQSLVYDDKASSIQRLQAFLDNENLNYFYTKEFTDLKKGIVDLLFSYYEENVSALLVPYDLPFFEKKSIEIFQELKRPNAVYLHGLPARYNNIDDNRADKLFVWGEAIKNNYIKAGVSENKILVTGHPMRTNQNIEEARRKDVSLRNVLVLTKVASGARSDNYSMNIDDCQRSLLYVSLVKAALLKAGIKMATLRLHPSENIKWYKRMIDLDFFDIDQDSLENSLSRASLVIGPATTVLLTSILAGTKFISFEPYGKKGYDLFDNKIMSPFDGSEDSISSAFSIEQLIEQINRKDHIENDDFLDRYLGKEFRPNIILEYLCQQEY